MRKIDAIFKYFCMGCAVLIGLLMMGFFIQLIIMSSDAWRAFGLEFLISGEWNVPEGKFGALSSIVGTLVTTAIALAIALPLSFAAALYLANARPLVSGMIGHTIDLLAAIPSVIYGMWGLFVLVPIMQLYVQPFMVGTLCLDRLPLVSNDFTGFGLLTAGTILAVMIIPYTCAVMRDVFHMTPPVLMEAAYGAGCTHYEVAKDIVLKYGMRGILGGVFIGAYHRPSRWF